MKNYLRVLIAGVLLIGFSPSGAQRAFADEIGGADAGAESAVIVTSDQVRVKLSRKAIEGNGKLYVTISAPTHSGWTLLEFARPNDTEAAQAAATHQPILKPFIRGNTILGDYPFYSGPLSPNADDTEVFVLNGLSGFPGHSIVLKSYYLEDGQELSFANLHPIQQIRLDISARNDSTDSPLSLTIVHVNDTHSHLEAISGSVQFNGEKTYLDMGGFARLVSKVDEVRKAKENTLFLHAGDAVQGTLYFTEYKGETEIRFMNGMNIDAMVPGNHEFDKGPGLLAHLIYESDFPIISANIDASKDNDLRNLIKPCIVKEIGGETVGIFGLTTPDTPITSSPGDDVLFENQKDAAERIVKELEARGVNKIIALTHLGYDNDKKLARETEGIDIIVGGHSHTLLDDLDEIGINSQGPYPTVVRSPAGHDVCVVQSWEWEKTVGVLDIDFDKNGFVAKCTGDAILLTGDTFQQKDAEGNKVVVSEAKKEQILELISASPEMEVVEEEPRVLSELAPYKEGISALQKEVIASAAEDLLHIREPGIHQPSGEAMPGGSYVSPLVCDAMLWKARSSGMKVQIILQNAGEVRTDIPHGDLTVGMVYEMLPFDNTMYLLELTGAQFKTALENGLTRRNGAFPYVGGARYTANMGLPEGSRVVSAEVKDENGEWKPLDEKAVYALGTNSYLANGGDGYEVLEQTFGYRYDTGFSDAEIFADYAEALKVLRRPTDTGVTYIPAK